jgi:hypothetical protein
MAWVTMPRRREVLSVLRGFVGTFLSRYSEFDGYWLFGFLVPEPREWGVDLLPVEPGPAHGRHSADPLTWARHLAKRLFADQCRKGAYPVSWLSTATLELHIAGPVDEELTDPIHLAGRPVYRVRAVASVTSDLGRGYSVTGEVLVCPFDPESDALPERLRSRNHAI